MPSLAAIARLGVKELRSLASDRIMLILILYVFSLGIYVAATVMPETLHNAPIAVIDEDASPLSARIADAFYPPHFQPPEMISLARLDPGLDEGTYTFVLDIPPDFQRDLLAGRRPSVQLNVDANRVSQAFTGSAYIQAMVVQEVTTFLRHDRPAAPSPVDLVLRARYNQTLTESWFGAVMEIINNVTMLSIILTGAALIRERERGTIEHLLAMPVSPFEIMAAKIWSMGLVVLVAAGCSLLLMARGVLGIPLAGSLPLFLFGAALNIFATTALGILIGTIARSMQQFGIVMILILIPLQVLSGGLTARDSMPDLVQDMMMLAPTTHFVILAQSILYRGAGFAVVWPELLALFAIGSAFFGVTVWYFRKAMTGMA
ncbi:ABC transporter permease [Magnetospirillum fulvum]|uniref:ABC-2 type transport system permease protein n=1 Tax=Magnetospirillum fulvum TaxID=1082 RepID=A0A1H6HA35_MAGFU|nr:ABC transporter permease [Magnetospirillum fulvum]SEH30843.1 ABC-2 type transport system permease protein [Magnetospirillum fulvum]